MDRRIPAAIALCIAALLVTNPLYLLPNAGEPTYSHDIEPITESNIPDDAEVLHYSNLSRDAKQAIEDARTDDGIVRGEENKPPEFFYSDHAQINHGIYIIEQNGSYYRLTTFAGGGLFPIDLYLQIALVLLGIGTGLIGYIAISTDRYVLPAAFAVYGALSLLAVAADVRLSGGPLGAGSGPILLGILAGFLASMVAVGLTASRRLVAGVVTAFAILLLFLVVTRQAGYGHMSVPVLFVFLAVPVLLSVVYGGRRLYQRVSPASSSNG